MKPDIKQQIERIQALGASYVDTRWVPSEENQRIVMWNGNLKENSLVRESGLGVRVLYKGAWGFSASSGLDGGAAPFDRALDNARVASERVRIPVRLADKPATQAVFSSPCQIDPFAIPLPDKLAFMRQLDGRLDQVSVYQRVIRLSFSRKRILYFDSDGCALDKQITQVFAVLEAYGLDSAGTLQERKFRLDGDGQGSRGWESLGQDLLNAEADRIVRELGRVLAADNCPREDRSVILMPGIMYLQTHETIGHALELDRILGYELAYAGGSFVTLDDFGRLRYGSPKLTVRANATLPNAPGSFGFDDDGVQCQDNVLIDKGVLVGAITGRQMVEEANDRAGRRVFPGSGGCNRAAAFYRVPIERMTNINVDSGQDGSLDDIVGTTERGIILDGDRSWSIGSNREQFHFANEIGWLVDDGRVTTVVKNATYRGDTLRFWNALSAVGDAATWRLMWLDNCGKGQPNQLMQTGHGVPVCRFDGVRIGE